MIDVPSEKEVKKKYTGGEVLRYIICGLICAAIDYFVSELFSWLTGDVGNWPKMVQIVIATFMGFVIGTFTNYVLSNVVVFKTMTPERKVYSKTGKFILQFFLLALVGLGISLGLMVLTQLFCRSVFDLEIADAKLSDITNNPKLFWAYFACFVFRSVCAFIWNYFSRKYWLYKTNRYLVNGMLLDKKGLAVEIKEEVEEDREAFEDSEINLDQDEPQEVRRIEKEEATDDDS